MENTQAQRNFNAAVTTLTDALTDGVVRPDGGSKPDGARKSRSKPAMYALEINWDYGADGFWESLYSRGTDNVPGELVPVIVDYWEHTLPMTRARLEAVLAWLRALPEWTGVDEMTRPATAMRTGQALECDVCGGEGLRGFKCGCLRHDEDCDREKCRSCCGTGFRVL